MARVWILLTAFAFAFALALGPAAASERIPPDAYARVNAALVENHVVPRYRRLAEATAALTDTAAAFCSGGDGPTMEDLRARYHEAMDAWMGVQHLRFGPVELFMRAHRLYFWPEARGRVGDALAEVLAGAETGEAAAERIGGGSVAVQGLPAVEHLLYEGEPLAAGGARCRLFVAITANMREMTAGIVADWRGGDVAFARAMSSPGPDNAYFRTHQDATLALFKSLHGGLQLTADVKLEPVIGASAATTRPALAESHPSGRTMRNIVINLEALEALYRGDGGPGLGDLAREFGSDAELDPLLRKAFPMTIESVRAVEGPLGEAAADPMRRPAVETLQTRVLALKQLARTRLAAALDLQVGFNAFDGD